MNKLFVYILLTVILATTAAATTCVYEFYGDGCPHCKNVEPFLDNLESQGVEIHRYETWNNKNNANMLNEYFNKYNVPNNRRGVPVAFVGENYYVGENEIKFGLNKELNRSYACPLINNEIILEENKEKQFDQKWILIILNIVIILIIISLVKYLHNLYF